MDISEILKNHLESEATRGGRINYVNKPFNFNNDYMSGAYKTIYESEVTRGGSINNDTIPTPILSHLERIQVNSLNVTPSGVVIPKMNNFR